MMIYRIVSDHDDPAFSGGNDFARRITHRLHGEICRGKRQHSAPFSLSLLILQQNDCFFRRLISFLPVLRCIINTLLSLARLPAQHFQAKHHTQDISYLGIHTRLVHFTFANCFQKRPRQIIILKIGGDTHLHIHGRFRHPFGRMGGSPVTYDNTVISPLLPQNVIQKLLTFTAKMTSELIVGIHNGVTAALLHRGFESRQINLS